MLLSKTDIARILRPISGSARFDDSDYLKARAIEAAVLAKLREQNEPVCIVGELSEPSRSDVINNKSLVIGQYLYANPAPIPEGWKELMIRTISRMRAAHVPCADIERSAEAMLAAARSG